MDDERRRVAKGRLVAGMVRGLSWAEAAADARIQASRSTTYRWTGAARTGGVEALGDGRQGHASKLRAPLRRWLVASCRASPHVASHVLQAALADRFGVTVSVRQINNVRAALGVTRVPRRGAAQGAGGKSWQRRAASAGLAGRRGHAAPARGRSQNGPHHRAGGCPTAR